MPDAIRPASLVNRRKKPGMMAMLTTVMTTPCSTAMTAERIWIRNFVHARREMMSSITPVMTMMIAPVKKK